MLNRPTNLFHQQPAAGAAASPWAVDRSPGLRLAWLFVIFSLPFAAVALRLTHLQYGLHERFAGGFGFQTETVQTIPSRDGRILGSDGRVLAYDVEQFSVSMHYRWLEEPPDANWLRQQALSRLGRAERRDPARVEAAEQQVLEQRRRMWNRLAELTGTPPPFLARQRSRVQRRVERIADSVNQRHQQSSSAEDSVKHSDAGAGADAKADAEAAQSNSAGASWVQAAWRRLIAALTTPPKRGPAERIVVKEQLDYHPVLDKITLHLAAQIESQPDLYPGLKIEVTTHRVYPEGPLAPHVIGSRTLISDEELLARRRRFPQSDPLDYRAGDRIGTSGVERSYDARLRGVRGLKKIVRNRRGEIVATEVLRKPRIGRDVELTLHLDLQQRAEMLLDELLEPHPADFAETNRPIPPGGCLIALDVHTGAVLAAVSGPRFDLNLFVEPEPDVWKLLIEDPRRPFFPRATQMALPPGSVFKALTAVALLEEGRLDPDAPMHCQGYLEHPHRHRCYIYSHYGVGHGPVDLNDALCQSCNVYFFAAADRAGPEALRKWATRFGFGRPTGIDLPGESGGNLPLQAAAGERSASRWYRGDTLGLAIGQSTLTATPLQIARLMAAVANGGYLVAPFVVREAGPMTVGDEDDPSGLGERSLRVSEPRPITGLSPETLRRVRAGLDRVVSHPKGTGYKRVRLEEIPIAGKTGTAEVGGGKPDHAWFAGYVPADNPRIAFAVVLEHGGSGGQDAGPLARRFVELMLETGLLQPRRLSVR